MDELKLTDQDGDTLTAHEVYGFGEPMLVLRVAQEDLDAGLNISIAAAKELRVYLDKFIFRASVV